MSQKKHPTYVHDQCGARYRPDDEVMPNVVFGRPDVLLTPAYWVMRCSTINPAKVDFVNCQGTLEEEVGFCLLGGFGVTFELASAFYERLRSKGLFDRVNSPPEETFLKLLSEPAFINGQLYHYRFPSQRASRLYHAMNTLALIELDEADPRRFRDQICSLRGVGLKTASWITRNWLGADSVAILDIHILRAGRWLQLFDKNCKLPRDYLALEEQFIEFARQLEIRTSLLDSVMWHDMRTFGSRLIGSKLVNCIDPDASTEAN